MASIYDKDSVNLENQYMVSHYRNIIKSEWDEMVGSAYAIIGEDIFDDDDILTKDVVNIINNRLLEPFTNAVFKKISDETKQKLIQQGGTNASTLIDILNQVKGESAIITYIRVPQKQKLFEFTVRDLYAEGLQLAKKLVQEGMGDDDPIDREMRALNKHDFGGSPGTPKVPGSVNKVFNWVKEHEEISIDGLSTLADLFEEDFIKLIAKKLSKHSQEQPVEQQPTPEQPASEQPAPPAPPAQPAGAVAHGQQMGSYNKYSTPQMPGAPM